MPISREFILKWNDDFPLDHWWRKKYNVSFNSEKHRSTSHLDMYFDWLEDKMFEQYFEEHKELAEKQKEFEKTGKWLGKIEKVVAEQKEKLEQAFDNIDISAFNTHFYGEEEETNIEDGEK